MTVGGCWYTLGLSYLGPVDDDGSVAGLVKQNGDLLLYGSCYRSERTDPTVDLAHPV